MAKQRLEDIIECGVEKMKGTKVMITSDYHIPFMDDNAYNVMLAYAKNYKPDVFIINGDFLDCYSISEWDRNPSRKVTMKNEIELGKQYLDDIKHILPKKCKMYFLEGNHESVDKNTDILTSDGWKNVTEVTMNDDIGQFNINTGEVEFHKPISLIKHHADKLIEIEGNNTKQRVTLNHDVVIKNTKIKAKELLNKKINQKDMFLSGNYNNLGVDISDDDIKLLTWVIMDGTIVDYKKYNPKSKKIRVQFKLSKTRKIDRLIALLESMDINYTFKKATMSPTNKLQPYYIRIYGDEARRISFMLNNKKQIPESWRYLNDKQLNIFLDELINTDGSKSYNHITWSSVNKNDVDIIQEVCLYNNVNCHYSLIDNNGFSKNQIYKVSIFNNDIQNSMLRISEIDYDDTVYCFENVLGTLITRLDGKVAFTGNCRLQRMLWKNPDMYELASEYINISTLLDLENKGIEFIGSDMDYWKTDNGHLRIGDMLIMHGDNRLNGASSSKYSGYSAKNTMGSLLSSIAIGHVHRLALVKWTTPNGQLTGIESGCLAQQTGTANWQQGFATFEVYGNKSINHRLYEINNGILYSDGLVYKSKWLK